jgi:predicted transcriptional regulator
MTTYTVPISEGLAARLAALSPEKVSAVNAEIAELIVDFLEEGESGAVHRGDFNLLRREDCTPEEIEDIEAGLADIEAGRVTDGPTFFAEFDRLCDALSRGEPPTVKRNGVSAE